MLIIYFLYVQLHLKCDLCPPIFWFSMLGRPHVGICCHQIMTTLLIIPFQQKTRTSLPRPKMQWNPHGSEKKIRLKFYPSRATKQKKTINLQKLKTRALQTRLGSVYPVAVWIALHWDNFDQDFVWHFFDGMHGNGKGCITNAKGMQRTPWIYYGLAHLLRFDDIQITSYAVY